MFSHQWCTGDHKAQRGTADVQTGVPAKPCLSLFQVFYWEKLSARTLRFFHSWKSLLGRGLLPWGFLDVMTAEGCRCWICLQIVQKLLVTGLLSDSLGLTATVNAWGYLILVCSASGHWKAPGNVFEPWHQEMSLSLDISVCKDWAMWHSHKCHHRKKFSLHGSAAALLSAWASTVLSQASSPSLEITLEVGQEN